MAGNDWQLVETEDYQRAVAQSGGAKVVDQILAPILYGISRNPEGFDHTDVPGVLIARTKLQMNGPDIVLAHSMWFRLSADEKIVELLWVELTNPEDVGF